MFRVYLALMIAFVTGIFGVATAPSARADESAVYEVTSSDIATADVEYSDITGQNAQQHVPLPWRIVVTVAHARSNDTAVNAKWPKEKSKWLTVRIYSRGSLMCEKTRDTGDLTCYGDTDHR